MSVGNINTISGKFLEATYGLLHDEGEGCASVFIGTSGDQDFYVVIGWHSKELPCWSIAWKIGVQPTNRHMKSDFDVDFDVPKNDESGEVDDTTELISCERKEGKGGCRWTAPKGYASWSSLARKIRREARLILEAWT